MPKDETATTTKRTRTASSAAPKGRKKDPNAPKRGLTAYMFYAADQREKVRAANPDMKFGQIHIKIGEQWKALSEEEKKPFEEKAAEDKKRYEEQKAAYKKEQAV